MRPTEGKLERLAPFAVGLGQMAVAAISIDLDDAVEARQDLIGILALSARVIMEDDAGRRRSVLAAIVTQHGPQITGFRPATPGIAHRGGGFVDIEPGATQFQQHRHAIDRRGDQRARPAHPVGKNRPLDRHPEPRHDSRLPVQRHVFGMFGYRNLCQKRLGRPTALQQMCRGLACTTPVRPLGQAYFGRTVTIT